MRAKIEDDSRERELEIATMSAASGSYPICLVKNGLVSVRTLNQQPDSA